MSRLKQPFLQHLLKLQHSHRSPRRAAMFSCRAAWQRCGPLARRAAYRLPRDVVQQRLSSSVPGGSGENIIYTVMCGGAFVCAMSYAYSTMSADSARFSDRIEEISARPKKEWVPKPWPPSSGEVEVEAVAEETSVEVEVAEEESAAAGSEEETVVEAVAEVIAEAAEAAEDVAEVVHEVETFAEVGQVAEAVEESAYAVTEPVGIAAEEPEKNVLLAAASVLEAQKMVELKEELGPAVEYVQELTSKEESPHVEAKSEEMIPVVKPTKTAEEVLVPVEIAPVEQAPAPAEAPTAAKTASVEEAPAPLKEPLASMDVKLLKEAPAPLEDAPPAPLEGAPPAPLEGGPPAPLEGGPPAPLEGAPPAPLEGAPPAPLEGAPPAPLEGAPPAPLEGAPVEQASAPAVEAPAPAEAAPAEALAPVVEDVPAPLEAKPKVEKDVVSVNGISVAEKSSAPAEPVSETPMLVKPDIASVLAEEPVTITSVEEVTATPAAEAASPMVEEAPASSGETLAEDFKKEYIVVVLEGTRKAEKSPMVLGLGPMTPDDNDAHASEGKRRLLRMQMQ